MKRITALIAVAVCALALAAWTVAAPSRSNAVTLTGAGGASFTISLKKGSGRVATLKRGKYAFVIRDRSAEHNFHLRGPVSRTFTGVSFMGTKTVTVTLRPGRYTYVCDPHADEMQGSFRVT